MFLQRMEFEALDVSASVLNENGQLNQDPHYLAAITEVVGGLRD